MRRLNEAARPADLPGKRAEVRLGHSLRDPSGRWCRPSAQSRGFRAPGLRLGHGPLAVRSGQRVLALRRTCGRAVCGSRCHHDARGEPGMTAWALSGPDGESERHAACGKGQLGLPRTPAARRVRLRGHFRRDPSRPPWPAAGGTSGRRLRRRHDARSLLCTTTDRVRGVLPAGLRGPGPSSPSADGAGWLRR